MRRFPRRAQGGRVSARPLECRQEAAAERFRGAEPSEAQLHEGAGEPAVDTCCPCPCGTRAAFAATYVADRVSPEQNANRSLNGTFNGGRYTVPFPPYRVPPAMRRAECREARHVFRPLRSGKNALSFPRETRYTKYLHRFFARTPVPAVRQRRNGIPART